MPESGLSPSGEVSPSIIARTVAWAAGAAVTGCLEVEHGGAVSRAFFRRGRPCGAVVLLGFKPLGLLLLEHEVIAMDDLEESLRKVAETRRPQGEILVEQGSITGEQLAYWLGVQQRDRFHLLLGLTEGSFRFDSDAELPPWTEEMELSPHGELLRFLRSEEGEPHVAALLEQLGAGPVLLSEFDPVPVFSMSKEESSLIESLAAGATVADAIESSPLERARAEGVVATLACFHYVTSSEEAGSPFAQGGDAVTGQALESLSEEAAALELAGETQEPRKEISSWRAPHLYDDGTVRFETIRDLDASIDLFIEQSALLVATKRAIAPEEKIELELVPLQGPPVAVTCALSSVPEEDLYLLTILDKSPPELIAALNPADAGPTERAAASGVETGPATSAEPPRAASTAESWTATGGPPSSPGEETPLPTGTLSEEPAAKASSPKTPPDSTKQPPPSREVPPIPPRGELSPPAHPRDLLEGSLRGGEKDPSERSYVISPIHLLSWLKSSTGDLGVVVKGTSSSQCSFEVLSGAQIQASVEIKSIASVLAQPKTRYEIEPLDEVPKRRVGSTPRKLTNALYKVLIRSFEENELEEALGPRMSLCPRLSDRGRRTIRGLSLSQPQDRVASQALDGTRRVGEILASGIGLRNSWELLYLLEIRGGLDWVSPPARVEEDPVATRWLAIQGKDHFEVLGLHWSSHPGAIERAYHALEGLYGPGGSLRDSSPKLAGKLWSKICEARDAVSTKAKRRAYRKERYPSMNFEYQAELLVGQARLAGVRADVEEAKTLLEAALDLAPISEAADLLRGMTEK